ncbi:glycosyltransferase [Actinomadura barringtoniae]|uniref:Glycosyltransferase n=1 Tax=Actinomadura barringtoniae TaxID=1427535 RepID=A0A939P7A3_9ACTN|nr:glycosyltransferase [Actinomadura barringtoniae]MBO2446745.1 glycosyltransferase [Actinomadura barringtoniae]
MRILFVSPYPPAKDGIGTYTHVLGGALRAAGHDVAVVTPRPLPGAPPEVIGALGPGGATQALREAEASFAPDVVHVQFAVPAFGSRTPAMVRWLGELSHGRPDGRAAVVTTMHEVTRDTALLRGAGEALYRRIAAGSDHVIVHTAAAQELVPGSQVVPHFSSPPPETTTTPAELRERFGLGESERLLLAFGFIHVDKGLDDLVAALGLLRRRDAGLAANVRVVVAGTVRGRTGPFRLMELRDHVHLRKVLRMARRARLLDRLVFTGFVPDGDIGAWFGTSEAVVLPYRKAEQSGVANLARAFGVPVLATTAGGLAELFADSPWTAPPAKPSSLADLLQRFLTTSPHDPPAHHVPELGETVAATAEAYRTLLNATRADIQADAAQGRVTDGR